MAITVVIQICGDSGCTSFGFKLEAFATKQNISSVANTQIDVNERQSRYNTGNKARRYIYFAYAPRRQTQYRSRVVADNRIEKI